MGSGFSLQCDLVSEAGGKKRWGLRAGYVGVIKFSLTLNPKPFRIRKSPGLSST